MKLAADSPLVDRLHPSPNVEPRRDGKQPVILLLHYTGLPTLERSLDVLSRPDCKVSCHYVVSETGEIVQMVAERLRAWHAGVAYWAGETDINSLSIGIEIQNAGHDAGCPDFPEHQMLSVERLCSDILARHAIPAAGVLAHSDVAPMRKRDPGEKFPWSRLAEAGVGLWVEPTPLAAAGGGVRPGDEGPMVGEMHELLARFGYAVPEHSRHDSESEATVRAFQRHYRPACCDGIFDASSRETLLRLLAVRDGGTASGS
ncbi:MAG: hypothetical protein RLZ98_106 [Pseudomonadota bacterium]